MITVGLWNGVWHVITRMDGALVCRMNKPENADTWDDNSMIEEFKDIPELTADLCSECFHLCLEADQRAAERESK